MLSTTSIREVPTEIPDLYVFRITGQVASADMEAMGERMLAVFEARDRVDMLLVFDGYEGTDFGASLNWASLKSRAASLSHVGTYAVAAAPEAAGRMVEAMGAILPLEAQAFDSEAEAMAFFRQGGGRASG